MRTDDFDYELPPELIAQRPLDRRDWSRLLVYDRASGAIRHERFDALPDLLLPSDVLLLNDSRVIPARLRGRKATGGAVELLLVRRIGSDTWQAMTRPGLRAGATVDAGPGLRAQVVGIDESGLRSLRFDVAGSDLDEAIERLGAMPVPPYIHATLEDPERYQTVYARERGSVAAPTAGLHFTTEVLDRLRERGVQIERVTLHVGPGTFQPVKAERLEEHEMHAEWLRVDAGTAARLEDARRSGRRIVAVGTTAVRALETAAASGHVQGYEGPTSLFIAPGYRFRAVGALLTNFHLPRSTLLMLVSAFVGIDQMRAIYREAIRQRYRFYSFGDCCLLL